MRSCKSYFLPILLLCSLCATHCQVLHAQTAHGLGKKDYELASLGLLMSGAGHYQSWRTKPLAPTLLDASHVPAFDRFATRNWSTSSQALSDASFGLAVLGAGTLLLDRAARREIVPLLVMGAEAMLLVDGLSSLSKSLILRPRPFMYNPDAPLAPKLKPDARFSFFSAHTALTSTVTFFTAKVLHDLHPGARWTKWTWVAAAALPAATAFWRVEGGKHFLSDVVTGYAVGAAMGILLPELHRNGRKAKSIGGQRVEADLHAAGAGLAFELRF